MHFKKEHPRESESESKANPNAIGAKKPLIQHQQKA